MLERYLDQVIKKCGIRNYELIHKCAYANDFPIILHNDIIVVHSTTLVISKVQAMDVNIQTLVTYYSPERRIDYNKNMFEVAEVDANNVHLTSRLIHHHNTRFDYDKPVPVNIVWGHVMYYLIKNHDA